MRSQPVHLALIALVLGALLPVRAQAQTCAMLPPGDPPGQQPPPEAQQAAKDAVVDALTDDGFEIIGSIEARRRMADQPFVDCNALACGSEVVRYLEVDCAVLVTLWAPRGEPTSVVVTLIGESDSAAGDAPIDGDVVPATLSALTVARQRWQATQMGFVEVRSDPAGADVEIDGRFVGQTPLRHLAMAGVRTIRIHHEGYEPVEEEVRVEPTRSHPVEVTLQPSGPAESVGPVSRTEPHWTNWLLGGGLVAGGVAALISPIHTLARLGECTDDPGLPAGLCRRGVSFGAQSAVLLSIGTAALIGGVVTLIGQPIQVTTTLTPDSASLQLSGTF